jgi:hypothetical protein
MLKNDAITVKLITGTWGSGKTLLLVSNALEAIEKHKFEKIVWIRNNVQVKDTDALGALPGSELDKMLPYVMPFADHCGGVEGVKQLIDDGVDGIMMGHVIVDAIDPVYPATLSRTLTTGYLREKLGFKGIIMTDAMRMKAIQDNYGTGAASVMAIKAGCDLVLLRGDEQHFLDGYEAILAAAKSGEITEEKAQLFADYVASRVPTLSNVRGSAEYRSHLVRVLTQRAILEIGGKQ